MRTHHLGAFCPDRARLNRQSPSARGADQGTRVESIALLGNPRAVVNLGSQQQSLSVADFRCHPWALRSVESYLPLAEPAHLGDVSPRPSASAGPQIPRGLGGIETCLAALDLGKWMKVGCKSQGVDSFLKCYHVLHRAYIPRY